MRLFILGQEIELRDTGRIAQTKQVNDIARLDNRQTNLTNDFSVPKTAKNIRTFQDLGLVGNNSNVPYQKNDARLFDDDGLCLIYNGWAIFTETAKDFKIKVYDGNIDFYKAIENKTLTEVGISGLNHLKNLTSVIDSFANDLPYMYIIADYNGKNTFSSANINIDYQLPSARVSYIWDRIFDFIGFTYTGTVFSSEKFLNFFMTYPKPVPVNTPVTDLVTQQNSQIYTTVFQEPGGEYVTVYNAAILPTAISSPKMSATGVVLEAGSFRITCSGTLTDGLTVNGKVTYFLRNSLNVLITTGEINGAIAQVLVINASVGDRFTFVPQLTGLTASYANRPLSGTINTKIELLLGFEANFEEALIDFKVTDFVNEVMQRFSLTMFKDKDSNNCDFRTMTEILQNQDTLDWSDKYVEEISEKYVYNNYAQNNLLKYRYNEENSTYNDGIIRVNNVNIKDETTIINSKFYTPERLKSNFLALQNGIRTYKFWNKEIKDDSTVTYKELTGRYYVLRAEPYVFQNAINIGSEVLNTTQSLTTIQRENYDRLRFQEIVYDNYVSIEGILDKSKIKTVSLYLKPNDIETFDFKRLIYLKQKASYFLVNKIPNYIKGKETKCELIEVDFLKNIETVEGYDGTFITITNTVYNDCEVTFTFDTDAILPVPISVIGFPDDFGVPNPFNEIEPWEQYESIFNPIANTITITVETGQPWKFYFRLNNINIISNAVSFDNTGDCTYVAPIPDLTYLTITSLTTYQIIGNIRKIRIDFTTDLILPSNITLKVGGDFGLPLITTQYTGSDNFILTEVDNQLFGINFVWKVQLSRLGIFSNVEYSNS
jgi:phage tail tube protein FII